MKRSHKAAVSACAPDLRTLHFSPELSAIEALRVAIDLTLDALRVANPILLTPSRFDGLETLSPQLWIAHQILANAQPMQLALAQYRRAAERTTEQKESAPEDSNLPF